MARRRRLIQAQPGYLGPAAAIAPETKSALGAPPIAQVSGQAAEAAALREVTEGLAQARATGRMVVDVPLGEVAPGYLARDRVSIDADEIGALKASIRSHGQRTPAEITPLQADGEGRADDGGVTPYTWGLIAGWRRLRALAELYDETGDARFSTLRALVRPPEEAAASYVAMVEENEIRVGLSYYERARVVAEAAARGVFPDQSAALRTLFATASRAKRSKIGSFIDIHEALGDLLTYPAEIPERLGLALVSRLRHGEKTRMRAALTAERPGSAAAELALLERLAKPAHGTVSQAKPAAERLREGVAMRILRRGDRSEIVLSGAGVNDRLAARLRAALAAPEEPAVASQTPPAKKATRGTP